jgi:hypothetical protein
MVQVQDLVQDQDLLLVAQDPVVLALVPAHLRLRLRLLHLVLEEVVVVEVFRCFLLVVEEVEVEDLVLIEEEVRVLR